MSSSAAELQALRALSLELGFPGRSVPLFWGWPWFLTVGLMLADPLRYSADDVFVQLRKVATVLKA